MHTVPSAPSTAAKLSRTAVTLDKNVRDLEVGTGRLQLLTLLTRRGRQGTGCDGSPPEDRGVNSSSGPSVRGVRLFESVAQGARQRGSTASANNVSGQPELNVDEPQEVGRAGARDAAPTGPTALS